MPTDPILDTPPTLDVTQRSITEFLRVSRERNVIADTELDQYRVLFDQNFDLNTCSDREAQHIEELAAAFRARFNLQLPIFVTSGSEIVMVIPPVIGAVPTSEQLISDETVERVANTLTHFATEAETSVMGEQKVADSLSGYRMIYAQSGAKAADLTTTRLSAASKSLLRSLCGLAQPVEPATQPEAKSSMLDNMVWEDE